MINNKIVMDYQDRGMGKWGGFYLSEHTAEISKDDKQRKKINVKKERMTAEEIDQVLHAARLKTEMISIQKEIVDQDNNYMDDVVGYISGYDERGIFLGEEKIDYDEIRNVSIVPFRKWSGLNDQ